jgi:hypothetical protein
VEPAAPQGEPPGKRASKRTTPKKAVVPKKEASPMKGASRKGAPGKASPKNRE